jgi:outer membrane protein assembly factor BamB
MRNVLICCFAFALLLPFATRAQQVTVAVSGTLTDPVACEGVVYFGSDNGNLYAVNAADGSAAPGFPVDIKAAVGDGSYPLSRPGVYYGSLGKAIYFETSKHGVVKVWPDGTVAWINKLDATSPVGGWATPAVTPDGEVFAEMKTSANIYLVKLKESDGSVVNTSAPLAMDYFNSVGSPCIVAGNVYVTAGSPATSGGGLIVLNRQEP